MLQPRRPTALRLRDRLRAGRRLSPRHDPPDAGRSAATSIGDYGLIGDCRTAALIGRDGSIDWLCLPRFDSPSLFAALLDERGGGRFRVRPLGPCRAERRYVGASAVLETTFTTSGGIVRLTDFMPVASEQEQAATLRPEHELLRCIEGVTGVVEMEIACEPRPDYGRSRVPFRDRGPLGFRLEAGSGCLLLRAGFPLAVDPGDGALRGRVRVRAGERYWVGLGYATLDPAVLPVLGEVAEERLVETLRWWEGWSRRCSYDGPFREAVLRSAITLKLLSYAPSGAIVAAPTTSLPEAPGGSRNWDYRYCWLRDASVTVRALFALGYADEAESFLSWMLHATRLSWPELEVLYDVYGGTRLPERELTHLTGFARSRPVRIGNDARGQLQLDIYGEVVDAAWRFVERGGRLDRTAARMLEGVGRTVCRRWREPDEGIWETRSGRRHHTLSRVMCWIALDRLLRLQEAGVVRVPVAELRSACEAIRAEVESRGFNSRLGSYVDELDGDRLDASLLLLGLLGYVDPASERMRGTAARIRERLGVDGLLYRSEEGIEGPGGREGAFGLCGFWDARIRALQGDREGAARLLETLVGYGNDLGLHAEEVDPATGEPLGNFPQAFTHIGLINAALALEGR